MKLTISILVLCLFVKTFQVAGQTNDFYDDAETTDLTFNIPVIEGEIANPGPADLSHLALRSVIVKETLLDQEGEQFIGAYRYDGYSLYDLLNDRILQKKNEAAFPPIIDLYVEVENNHGEKVVLSWGELYYPIHRHEIIIATKVARIVPSKTKELWPLPVESKLIVASDLFTHRNISNPVRITVRSYSGDFVITKGMKPMFAGTLTIADIGKEVIAFREFPEDWQLLTYPAVFYGRGTGIHGTTPFTGVLLKQVLDKYIESIPENLKRSMFIITGKDGYHAVFSFAEIMNRNDQAEVLLLTTAKNEDGGYFKIFPAADFFSDRAIKSVESVDFRIIN